jgi:predicted nucleotidyltransferase
MNAGKLPTGGQKLKIAKIAKKFQLKLILVFGSFASGKNREDSDLDVAVLGAREISFAEQINLINEFAGIFHKNIDLSVLNRANPLLIFQASQNSILLFGTREEFLKFKLYAFKSYNDYAPYFEMEKNLNKKIINAYANR